MQDLVAAIITALTNDSRVVGLLLGGSRGKGLATEFSDWDLYVVVADDVPAAAVYKEIDPSVERLDLCGVLTLDEFAQAADVGSVEEWNRYNFAHLTPILDRTGGRLQAL